MDTMQTNCAPWSAKYLGKETEFVCRGCGSEIVKKGSIGTWRDLPSENWAEMMDFWHCHKPEVPGGHVEQSAANRGYGANTKFTPTPGIGFVDLTSFLLADTDCQNTQVRDTVLLKLGLWQGAQRGYQEGGQACFCCSMAWPPIQVPKINTLLPLCAAAIIRTYPFF
jgi:hypothetical protein